MQVLQVITSLYTGGAEKLLVDSIPIYREKGIDMELLLLNGDETPFFQTLKKSGIKIHYLTKGNIRKIYNPLLVFRIIPFLKKYDIVHVHLFPTLYWAALAKRLSFGKTKLVFTEHNTHNRRIGNITGRVLDKFIYHQYDTIVSITKEVDTIIKLHLSFKKDKFKIIHNGINLSQFVRDFPKDENTVHSKIILIQVSAFREQKDQVTLIRALHYLPQNVNLLLVGDGDKRTKCEDLVKELNLSGRVSFLGVRMDVPQLLESAYIVILSSRYEGLSLSSIEAMASGRPFIASDVPGLRDVVKGAGLLFPPGNEKKLAEHINSLLSDRELYEKVAKDCLNRAKEYDINNMVDQYIELYKSIINEC